MRWVYILIAIIIVAIIVVYLWATTYYSERIEQQLYKPKGIVLNNIGKHGQMGNQMFQLAAAVKAAKEYECPVYVSPNIKNLPIWELFEDSFTSFGVKIKSIKPKFKWRQLEQYKPIVVNGMTELIGRFEDTRYFPDNKTLQTLFKPSQQIINKVSAQLPNRYIAIHIRHSDNEPWYHDYPFVWRFSHLYTPNIEYFKRAIKRIKKKLGPLPIFVFTDNPKWCRKIIHLLRKDGDDVQMNPLKDATSVDDWVGLYLAEGLIISGSTFSLWASILGHSKYTIRPYPVYKRGSFGERITGIRGEHQKYGNMIELDGITGDKLNIKDEPDFNSKWPVMFQSIILGT